MSRRNMQRGAFEENVLSKMEAQNKLLSKSINEIKKEVWNEAIEYIIPIATADYHITAEELRKHKK